MRGGGGCTSCSGRIQSQDGRRRTADTHSILQTGAGHADATEDSVITGARDREKERERERQVRP